jgi:xanthine dehydrogenase YagR molybdenum-binding subunit
MDQLFKIGTAAARVDGRLKVTGEARYASDMPLADPVYAFLVTSAIARGRIAEIGDRASRALPGVLEILTHRNMADAIKPTKLFSDGGYVGSTIMPLASDQIWHAGQIVAVVLAESFEAARDGAHRLNVTYIAQPPSAGFDADGTTTVAAKEVSGNYEDPAVGDAAAAFDGAAIKVDQHYATPTQHHNPIELFTTTCAWSGDRLTVWEGSQNVTGLKHGLAEQLGIDPDKIRVVSPYIGGAFGSRGSVTQRTALIAIAARRLNRPVKLVATRDQGFTIATYRAETRHHVRVAANRDGKLIALIHDAEEVTSRPDNYKVAGTDASTRLYACPNIASKVSLVHADRNTPGFMRSPPEVPYLFALESAMDELAVELNMDPVELRRRNDTLREPIKDLPYTSRSLMPCFEAAAKTFGWDERDPRPGSMRDGDWLVGWGCAATMYPTQMGPATARVTMTPQGIVRVQTAAHDIGTGAYTVIALTAADRLGVAVDKIHVELGDTELPPAPVAGGSNTTASVCNVVAKACQQIRARIAKAAVAAPDGPFAGRDCRYARARRRHAEGWGRNGRAARYGDRPGVERGHRVLRRKSPARRAGRRAAEALSRPRRAGRRRQAKGSYPIRLWRRIRRGPSACSHLRDPLSAGSRCVCCRPDRRPNDCAKPADGWTDLGRILGIARGNRDRSPDCPLL